MPLMIKETDVKWHQTENKVIINVTISSRVDIKHSMLVTSRYLKINSPPYLWECFLVSSIDPECSIIRIEDGNIFFELQKEKPEIWSNLTDIQSGNEKFRKEKREAAFEENKKRLEDSQQLKCQEQQKRHKANVTKQMELDELERKRVEKEMRLENEKATAEIERKKLQFEANLLAQKRKSLLQSSQAIPPTRKPGHITVSFTSRVFPTAARESQETEEKEWLEKQLAASKSLNFDCKDLLPEERNPEWLKAKAESMFKREDFRSAVNAYNLAIRMCPNLHSLHLGRAACHLKLRNLHKSIEDASKALELLIPHVPSNASARKEAHRTRGLAFEQLHLPVEGFMDIKAALNIDPKDEELQKDAQQIKLCIENISNI